MLQVEQGWIGVATIYLGGGVCGALGASLLQPSLFLVGSSAGVYALLTSHLAHLYLVSSEETWPNYRLPGDGSKVPVAEGARKNWVKQPPGELSLLSARFNLITRCPPTLGSTSTR